MRACGTGLLPPAATFSPDVGQVHGLETARPLFEPVTGAARVASLSLTEVIDAFKEKYILLRNGGTMLGLSYPHISMTSVGGFTVSN